jgi:predicted nucleic acid-binding protein
VLVLDASAAVELVVETPLGRVVAAHLKGEGGPLHAPHLLDVEVLSALRQLARTGRLPREDVESAMSSFRLLPVVRYPHSHFLDRAWQLRETVSAYDAMYIALAEALDAPLLTCDGPLAAAHGHRAEVLLARIAGGPSRR